MIFKKLSNANQLYQRIAIQVFTKKLPNENIYFILVSKKHIKCIMFQELKEGKEISSTSINYLGSRKEFDLQKEVIIDFCNFAVQFFDGV